MATDSSRRLPQIQLPGVGSSIGTKEARVAHVGLASWIFFEASAVVPVARLRSLAVGPRSKERSSPLLHFVQGWRLCVPLVVASMVWWGGGVASSRLLVLLLREVCHRVREGREPSRPASAPSSLGDSGGETARTENEEVQQVGGWRGRPTLLSSFRNLQQLACNRYFWTCFVLAATTTGGLLSKSKSGGHSSARPSSIRLARHASDGDAQARLAGAAL